MKKIIAVVVLALFVFGCKPSAKKVAVISKDTVAVDTTKLVTVKTDTIKAVKVVVPAKAVSKKK